MNTASDLRASVSGGYSNTASGEKSSVSGGRMNKATGNESSISGGESNTASDLRASVSGGYLNTASGEKSSVSGGSQNTASFYYASVSGGSINTASGNSSSVSGGKDNTAHNSNTSVSGGESNYAHGTSASVSGGKGNFARGYWSSIVGGENYEGNVNLETRTGELLTLGLISLGEVTTTALNITSDRNAKEQFKPVDARQVLEKVADLPISEWQFKTQSDARHIGPMAQDFRAAFAVGRDESHITSVDADGVALAAIQGLNEKLEEQVRDKNSRIKALENSLADLKSLVNMLAARQKGAKL